MTEEPQGSGDVSPADQGQVHGKLLSRWGQTLDVIGQWDPGKHSGEFLGAESLAKCDN